MARRASAAGGCPAGGERRRPTTRTKRSEAKGTSTALTTSSQRAIGFHHVSGPRPIAPARSVAGPTVVVVIVVVAVAWTAVVAREPHTHSVHAQPEQTARARPRGEGAAGERARIYGALARV